MLNFQFLWQMALTTKYNFTKDLGFLYSNFKLRVPWKHYICLLRTPRCQKTVHPMTSPHSSLPNSKAISDRYCKLPTSTNAAQLLSFRYDPYTNFSLPKLYNSPLFSIHALNPTFRIPMSLWSSEVPLLACAVMALHASKQTPKMTTRLTAGASFHLSF